MALDIAELAREINAWADDKGWNEKLTRENGSVAIQVLNMVTELAEAWEEIRNNHAINEVYYPDHPFEGPVQKPEGFPIEIADCIVRILHMCQFYGIDIEDALRLKMEYNKTRPHRHGGKSS